MGILFETVSDLSRLPLKRIEYSKWTLVYRLIKFLMVRIRLIKSGRMDRATAKIRERLSSKSFTMTLHKCL